MYRAFARVVVSEKAERSLLATDEGAIVQLAMVGGELCDAFAFSTFVLLLGVS